MASDIPTTGDVDIDTLRAEVIGKRQPLAVIARMQNHTMRTVYETIERCSVSFIKVGPDRYIDPVEYAEKRARGKIRSNRTQPEPLPLPRSVGRPRKSRK
jgi:hypothetical protein